MVFAGLIMKRVVSNVPGYKILKKKWFLKLFIQVLDGQENTGF